MIEAMSITEARKRFLELVREVSGGVKKVLLTKHGRLRAIIMSSDEYFQMKETLDILLDSDEVRELAQGLSSIKEERENGEQ